MNSKLYLVKRVALSLGLMALGGAIAWGVALVLLQDAATAAGALPASGTQMNPDVLVENPLWQAAKTLSKLERGAGGVGAVLVLAYGVVDRFEDEILEVLN